MVTFIPLGRSKKGAGGPEAWHGATFRKSGRRILTRAPAAPASVTRAAPTLHVARAKISCGMPIYEYECYDCRRRVSLLVLRPSTAPAATCPRCHGSNLSRLMSRFATIRSEDERLESMADASSFGDLNEDDPASVARFMKKMGKEFGDDLGDDFESAVDEALTEGDTGGPAGATEGPSESLDASGAPEDL